MYGIRQESHNWYHKFIMVLLKIDYKQSRTEHSLFIYKCQGSYVATLIYVDDLILVGNDASKIQETKDYVNKAFNIKDLGILKYFFLGIEVARTEDVLVLSQYKYTWDILEDSGMEGCRPSIFSMEQNLKLDQTIDSPCVDPN